MPPDESAENRDSLDKTQRSMSLEEELADQISFDPSLTEGERHRLIRELEDHIKSGTWEDDDTSPLSVYVRSWNPGGPGSRSGSVALPEPTGDEEHPGDSAVR